ncbi:MAG: NADase-type glycan-binding domain-containing protein [bacterium]
MRKFKVVLVGLMVLLCISAKAKATIQSSASSILENKARYSHKNIIDGDIFTAWSEGNKGDGIGEWVKLDFGEMKTLYYIGIIPGYSKYNDKVGEVWFKNNRVKNATLEFSDGSKKQIELIDKQQIQYFKVGKKSNSVKIIIDEVYKGSTWPDTCISEVKPVFELVDDLNAKLDFNIKVLPKDEDEFYGLTDLQATYQENNVRSQVNLSLVIDRSGSMSEGDKIKFVREAAKLILGSLDEKDFISIVGYDDRIETFLEPTHLTQDEKNKVAAAIDGLQPRNMTNISGALMRGIELVKKKDKPEQIKRIILLSDGLANVGITDPRQIANIADKAFKNDGIVISTFGVGEQYNEDLLAAIANVSLGKYYYVKNPKQMFMYFHSEITNLTKVVLKDIEVRFDEPKDYKIAKIYGYDWLKDGNDIVLKLPSFKLGEKKYLLTKFKKVRPSKDIIVTQQISYFNDLIKKRDSKKIVANLNVSSDKKTVRNEQVSDEILKILSAEKLEDSIIGYQQGKDQDAIKNLEDHIKNLSDENKYLKSKVLEREITILTDILSDLKKTKRSSQAGQRLIKSSKERALNILKGETE